VENREQKEGIKAHLWGLGREHEAKRCGVLRGFPGKGNK
jgi:hypothetical protein